MRPQGPQGPQGPWGAQTSLATFVARHVKAGAWDGKTLGPGPQRKSPAGATVAIKPLVKVYRYIYIYIYTYIHIHTYIHIFVYTYHM